MTWAIATGTTVFAVLLFGWVLSKAAQMRSDRERELRRRLRVLR